MATLCIYGKQETGRLEGLDAEFVYYLASGRLEQEQARELNDASRLNATALAIRDDYCSFIFSANGYFKDLGLTYQNRLSLYFLSDLAVKRMEVFETFDAACHITLLKELISENAIDRVLLYGCTSEFVRAFKSGVDIQTSESETVMADSSRFKGIRTQLRFFLAAFIKVLLLKSFNFPAPKKPVKRLFLTRYPRQFGTGSIDIKYGPLKNDSDCHLLSVLTDGLHQKIGILAMFRAMRRLEKLDMSYLVLDRGIGLREVLAGFFWALRLERAKSGLKECDYSFKSLDLGGYMALEIDLSMLRIPRLLMHVDAVREALESHPPAEFVYYLHEFGYGRLFAFVIKEYFPDIRLTGFQHGPSARTRLLYYLAENEPAHDSRDFLNHLPVPDRVLAEDELSMKVYLEAGYRNVEVVEDVYRLSYLKDIKRDNVQPETVLIAFSQHDVDLVVEAMRDEIAANPKKKYLFKFHPKTRPDERQKAMASLGADNAVLAEEDIYRYLAVAGEVVVTYSSVGLEAHVLGIPVRLLAIPNKVSISPLVDIYAD